MKYVFHKFVRKAESKITPLLAGTIQLTQISSLPDCRRDLATTEKEIQHLRDQLKMQEALLAAKDETITLLRIAFNRPN